MAVVYMCICACCELNSVIFDHMHYVLKMPASHIIYSTAATVRTQNQNTTQQECYASITIAIKQQSSTHRSCHISIKRWLQPTQHSVPANSHHNPQQQDIMHTHHQTADSSLKTHDEMHSITGLQHHSRHNNMHCNTTQMRQ